MADPELENYPDYERAPLPEPVREEVDSRGSNERGGQAAGAVMQGAGAVAQGTGKATSKVGKGTMKAGAALSRTGVGAVVGVPLSVAGGAIYGTGKGIESAGKATRRGGRNVRKAYRNKARMERNGRVLPTISEGRRYNYRVAARAVRIGKKKKKTGVSAVVEKKLKRRAIQFAMWHTLTWMWGFQIFMLAIIILFFVLENSDKSWLIDWGLWGYSWFNENAAIAYEMKQTFGVQWVLLPWGFSALVTIGSITIMAGILSRLKIPVLESGLFLVAIIGYALPITAWLPWGALWLADLYRNPNSALLDNDKDAK